MMHLQAKFVTYIPAGDEAVTIGGKCHWCDNPATDICYSNDEGQSRLQVYQCCERCAKTHTEEGEYKETCPNCGCWIKVN